MAHRWRRAAERLLAVFALAPMLVLALARPAHADLAYSDPTPFDLGILLLAGVVVMAAAVAAVMLIVHLLRKDRRGGKGGGPAAPRHEED